MLKINFPVISPNLDGKASSKLNGKIDNSIAEKIKSELSDIKQQLTNSESRDNQFKEIQTNSKGGNQVKFTEIQDDFSFENNNESYKSVKGLNLDNSSNSGNNNDYTIRDNENDIVLLGELLKHLRETKELSCLMLCRKINKLSVQNNVVEVDIDDSYIEELSLNDKYVLLLTEFFKNKNLDFKIKGKIVIQSDVDRLNMLLGGKLIIKHTKNVWK